MVQSLAPPYGKLHVYISYTCTLLYCVHYHMFVHVYNVLDYTRTLVSITIISVHFINI